MMQFQAFAARYFRQSQNKKQVAQRCPSTESTQEVTQPLAERAEEPSCWLLPAVSRTLSDVKMEYFKEKTKTLPARARNHSTEPLRRFESGGLGQGSCWCTDTYRATIQTHH